MPPIPASAADALLADLNPPQREAVTHPGGPLLILAGAGSGKTRVLTHRIAHLMATEGARAGEILAITFTNRAAREMRERVEALVGPRVRAMWVMTFHAACTRMLRADAHRLGYTRQFSIYDQADARRAVKHCLDELGIDPKRFTPAAVHRQISDAKNRLRDADAYAELVGSYFEQTVADVYRLYERELHRMNAMDFDDLLVHAVNALELFQEVRDRYRGAFRHVLVYEYQDTNHAQYRWLELLAGGGDGHRNLCVVGDDAQSIYGFRGADINNILSFSNTFPDAHVIRLEQNYRSTQTILDAANAVVARNRGQMVKHLWSDAGAGEPVALRELDDEHAEARYVAGEIERLVDEGASREEIAVFYRTNAQSRVLEDTLVRADVAYQVIGGTRFYERAEVKDALAYLTVLVNPADEVSFTRIVSAPRRGIGATSLARVLAHANTTGQSVWDAASQAGAVPGLGAAAVKAIGRFMATMATLRERAETGASVEEILRETLEESGYLEALRNERTIEAQGRIENLDELTNVAGEFDAADDGQGGLEAFLQEVALVADADGLRDERGMITLMTLHNAKGLEYPIVFMLGCEEGVFPHTRALEEGNLEEERRLCYVGITRARRALYLTWARSRTVFGSRTHGLRSRFVDEIPSELTDREDERVLVGRPGDAARWFRGPGASARAGDARGTLRANAAGEQDIPDYRLGDDVVHAAYGDGVVTAVEPGGIVIVRFSGDGSERRLIAGLAPVSKRAG
jgi:DNA helicase-2/ATP-dependent DNA helicase PcrA